MCVHVFVFRCLRLHAATDIVVAGIRVALVTHCASRYASTRLSLRDVTNFPSGHVLEFQYHPSYVDFAPLAAYCKTRPGRGGTPPLGQQSPFAGSGGAPGVGAAGPPRYGQPGSEAAPPLSDPGRRYGAMGANGALAGNGPPSGTRGYPPPPQSNGAFAKVRCCFHAAVGVDGLTSNNAAIALPRNQPQNCQEEVGHPTHDSWSQTYMERLTVGDVGGNDSTCGNSQLLGVLSFCRFNSHLDFTSLGQSLFSKENGGGYRGVAP